MRTRWLHVKATETVEEREERLRKQRESNRRYFERETPERKEARLEKIRAKRRTVAGREKLRQERVRAKVRRSRTDQ